MWQAIATVSVERDGEARGILTTENRQYVQNDQIMTEVGIAPTPLEDLYLILAGVDDLEGIMSGEAASEGIDLQTLVKPLVSWIWFGCLILAGGTVVALWPSVDRKRAAAAAVPAAPVREPALAASAD
jgi:cytochrome c-type biogenesis protein CcmF